jgi:hypothetical protein
VCRETHAQPASWALGSLQVQKMVVKGRNSADPKPYVL